MTLHPERIVSEWLSPKIVFFSKIVNTLPPPPYATSSCKKTIIGCKSQAKPIAVHCMWWKQGHKDLQMRPTLRCDVSLTGESEQLKTKVSEGRKITWNINIVRLTRWICMYNIVYIYFIYLYFRSISWLLVRFCHNYLILSFIAFRFADRQGLQDSDSKGRTSKLAP